MGNLGRPLFDFDTKTLGRITVRKPTVGTVVAVQREIDGRPFAPVAIVEAIIRAMATRPNGTGLLPNDTGRISDEERRRFAELFLEHNQHLLEPDVLTYSDPSLNIAGDTGDNGPEARLARGWIRAHRRLGESTRGFIAEAGSPSREHIMPRSLSDSLRENQASSQRLGSMLSELGADSVRGTASQERPTFTLPPGVELPENPVWETNRRLAALEGRFDEIRPAMLEDVAMIKNLNDAAADMLLSFAAASGKTDAFSRRSIWVALVALLISFGGVVTPILYDRGKSIRQDVENRQTIERIVGAISEVRGGQAETLDRLVAAIEAGAARDEGSREALRSALEGLSERLKAVETLDAVMGPPAQQREGEAMGRRPERVPTGE
ncbi:hypothetical protein [Belnapia moabensis]|uniref:hypothetical protein n=1 Tax=Belnapia moabensis TaxID=365533 RepID=UPI0005BB65EA|nr:hypothetical protein [Belnapia moabensis]